MTHVDALKYRSVTDIERETEVEKLSKSNHSNIVIGLYVAFYCFLHWCFCDIEHEKPPSIFKQKWERSQSFFLFFSCLKNTYTH